MAKRVNQPAYAVTVGHFLDVSQAYLAIWRRSIPTQGQHRSGWLCAMPLPGAAISNSRFGDEYVA